MAWPFERCHGIIQINAPILCATQQLQPVSFVVSVPSIEKTRPWVQQLQLDDGEKWKDGPSDSLKVAICKNSLLAALQGFFQNLMCRNWYSPAKSAPKLRPTLKMFVVALKRWTFPRSFILPQRWCPWRWVQLAPFWKVPNSFRCFVFFFACRRRMIRGIRKKSRISAFFDMMFSLWLRSLGWNLYVAAAAHIFDCATGNWWQ